MLINLVTTPLKFTERGEVIVRVNAEETDDGQVRLRFAVRDTGAGIPDDRRCRLFQFVFRKSMPQPRAAMAAPAWAWPFPRAWSNSWAARSELIAKWASAPNSGARSLRAARRPARRAREIPDELRQMRILAVDDNATNREILAEHFKSWADEPDHGQRRPHRIGHAAAGGHRGAAL